MLALARCRPTIGIALLISALSCGLRAVAAIDASGTPKGHIRFEAVVSDLRLSPNSLAAGMADEDKLSVTLPGEVFRSAIDITPALKTAVSRVTLDEAAASDYGAFRAGDGDWIAENFTTAEASGMRENFSDQMIGARTRSLFDAYAQKRIVGRAVYNRYQILFINYKDWPIHLHPEVYVNENGVWKRTNALNSNETFDIISAALKSGRTLPEP